MSRWDTARSFLDHFAGNGTIPGGNIAVVVAHPDDETLGLGAQLPRLPGVTIVHVTDGAPRNLKDARRLGFATSEAYARARRRELEAAMALVGIGPESLIGFAVPDQEASFELARIAVRLARFMSEKGIEVVFTHAYEGGHPDHEATAFAVHAAADLLARTSTERPAIIEMPFYRATASGRVLQRFIPDPDRPEFELTLSEDQRALKRSMAAAHRSQASVLSQFPIAVERFREAPSYDFTILPPVDVFLYEEENWGLDRERWVELVKQAQTDLAEVKL
jgi:N-acetylglucosamine malate deacetylase 2